MTLIEPDFLMLLYVLVILTTQFLYTNIILSAIEKIKNESGKKEEQE